MTDEKASSGEWSTWFRENTDKLILVFLILVFVAVVVITRADKDLTAWAREQTGTIIGALLGLVTGVALGRRMAAIESASKTEPPKEKP